MARIDAADKLRKWRGTMSLVKAGTLIGCDPSYVYLLETRQICPGYEKRELVEKATKIPAKAWSKVEVTTRKRKPKPLAA